MAELKTKKNDASVLDFLNGVKDEQKKADSLELLKIFESVTKEKAMMWGKSIVGFGSYHYKSTRSKQEGDWPLTGFSPRKQNISLYIMPGFKEFGDLLDELGTHKVSGGCCLYLKKLSDVNIPVLKKIIKKSVKMMKGKHNC